MEPENSPYGIIHWYIAKMPHPNNHLFEKLELFHIRKKNFSHFPLHPPPLPLNPSKDIWVLSLI